MYKNIEKFDIQILDKIDTEVIYERFDMYKNTLRRLDTANVNEYYDIIRFYPNSYFSKFGYKRDDIFNVNSFDPLLKGYRGIYYLEKGKIRYDIFVPTTGMGYMGRITGELIIKEDTIIFYRGKNDKYPAVYIKCEVLKEYLDYEVN